jgi:hypothetical protein
MGGDDTVFGIDGILSAGEMIPSGSLTGNGRNCVARKPQRNKGADNRMDTTYRMNFTGSDRYLKDFYFEGQRRGEPYMTADTNGGAGSA